MNYEKTTKKLVSLGLAAVMAASLTACGGKSDNGATTAGAAETTAAADAGAAESTAADQTAGGSFKIGGITDYRRNCYLRTGRYERR